MPLLALAVQMQAISTPPVRPKESSTGRSQPAAPGPRVVPLEMSLGLGPLLG